MDTRELLEILQGEGYSLRLIATQTDVAYMRLYRFLNTASLLTDYEHDRVKQFALVQPCMRRL